MATTTAKPAQKSDIYNRSDERPVQQVQTPLIDKALEETTLRLEETSRRYADAVADPTLGRLARAMVMAEGIEKLRQQLAGPVMKRIMGLMNSPLGFKTDRGPQNPKNPQPYDEITVRDAVIVALLNGVYPLFNEMNIIAGQCYITKEGYQRKVREIPELTDLVLSPGVPFAHNGQTTVRYAATWRYRGLEGKLVDGEGKNGIGIPIPSNQFMGPDAIIGKATRKALKRIYEQVTGSVHTIDDGDAEDVAVGSQTVQAPSKATEPGKTRGEILAERIGSGHVSAESVINEATGEITQGDAAE